MYAGLELGYQSINMRAACSIRPNGPHLDGISLPSECQSRLWKVPAFGKPCSKNLDPVGLRTRSMNIQKIHHRGADDDNHAEDVWKNPCLDTWVIGKEPLILFQGNYQSINLLEEISVQISSQLEEKHPTIFMISEPCSREYFLDKDEMELLRQLAIQALRKISVPWNAPFLTRISTRFRKALSCQDWFDILEDMLSSIPSIFVIIDVGILCGKAECARTWPIHFQRLISRIKSKVATHLSVMLLSCRPFSTENIDAPIITVASKPGEFLCQEGISPKQRMNHMPHLPELLSKRRQSIQEKVSSATRLEEHPNIPTPEAKRNYDCIDSLDDSRRVRLRTAMNTAPQEVLPAGFPFPSQCIGEDGIDSSTLGETIHVSNTGSHNDKNVAEFSPTTPRPPSYRHGFKIAIICALTLEADAVEILFDQHWDTRIYGKSEGDTNAYSFGMIGLHNVVLVHMPGMGKGNAATAAASCRASFPGIRLALVVGICAGVPFTRHSGEILLGDVIISDALVQYDFGRQFPDGFRRKETADDNMRKPPDAIRSLLSKLKGRRAYQTLRERTNSHLETLHRELGECAVYPEAKDDILFQSTHQHKHRGSTCTDCTVLDGSSNVCDAACESTCEVLGCDPNQLVLRKRHSQATSSTGSSQRLPQPVIHFGTFASGDTVMKSGEDRDKIAAQEGAIAFEMEGAGVWEIFPSVIIKGVCDYADSHKSKKWQDVSNLQRFFTPHLAYFENWFIYQRGPFDLGTQF